MFLLKSSKAEVKEISKFLKAKMTVRDLASFANVDLSLFRRVLSDDLNGFLDFNNITQLWDLIHLSENDFKLLYRTSFLDREVSEKECLLAFFTLDLILKEFDLAFSPGELQNLKQRDINAIKLHMLLIENHILNQANGNDEELKC